MDAKDRRIAELENRIAELEALVAKLQKNSTNSSKPPSSDIVKPPRQQDRRRKKKIGGQKGHKQNLRTPFEQNQIDETVELKLESCPKCNGKLTPTGAEPKKHQQVEYWCEACQCTHTAKLPAEVKRAGLFGKNLIAHTAYLKGRCHMSFKTMQDFYADACLDSWSFASSIAERLMLYVDRLIKPLRSNYVNGYRVSSLPATFREL